MLHTSTRRTSSQKRSPRVQPEILKRITEAHSKDLLLDYLESLGCARALSVWMLFKAGEHDQLIMLTISSLDYDSVDLFRRSYLATKFFSKCSDLTTTVDREAVALDSALKAERQCRETNQRIRMYRSGALRHPLSSEWFRAQQLIATILGPLPDSFPEVGWSPGRTSSAFGMAVASAFKYASRLDVTLSARVDALRVLRDSPSWGAAGLDADGPCSVLERGLNIVKGNNMITVPKSAKTDRVICYEPHMNIRLQLAIGDYIRKKLLRVGVNLDDQSINQRRAKVASKTGHLATIDLSMASDTLSLELVFDLLPIDWAIHLDKLRSRYTLWPNGTQTRNEKFSSMGNGFTFELESLIFFALARSVSDDVSVYGDDIICPTSSFDRVKSILEDAGFALNTAKSFHQGFFRESCGADMFHGFDCTPVYLRKLPKTKEDVVKLHNAIRGLAAREVQPSLATYHFLSQWRRIHTVTIGPSGYGDGHYHVNFDEASPKRASFGIDGWWYSTYIRLFKVNTVYGDRVAGHFPARYGWGALCATTGPKRNFNVIDATVDRRQFTYRRNRGLANFVWPDIVWF